MLSGWYIALFTSRDGGNGVKLRRKAAIVLQCIEIDNLTVATHTSIWYNRSVGNAKQRKIEGGSMKALHYAQYGNVIIKRAYCEKCKGYSLVIKGVLQCCDTPVEEFKTTKKKVFSEAFKRRKRPHPKVMRKILAQQDNKCLYCELPFGTPIWREKGRKIIFTKVTWDHRIPFSYGYNNKDDNFVASCQICNMLKGNKIFETLEEVRDYVQYKRRKKGYHTAEEVATKKM